MIYSCLISLCLFGFGGADIVTSSITVLDSYGIQLTSPAAIEENNQIDFRCTATYSQTGTEWTNNLNLINNSVTDLQLRCFGKSDTTADEKYISTDGFLIPNSQSCLYNQLSARFQIGSEPSLTLQCSWSSFTGPYVKIDEFDIQTYASPSKPTVTQTLPSSVNTPKVGDDVTYTCTSTARPPPKLRFSFSKRVIRASELTHTPAIVNITDDSAEATSTLTWTTKATSDMHGEYLFCQVYDHMSGLMESNELRMKVYFGPLPHTDVDLQWNLASVSTLNINCSLECHGCVSYEWYTGSVLPENKLSQTGKTLPIENTVFIHISGFDEEIITYICRSFNTHTNLTTTLETNVKVYTTATTKAPIKGSGSQSDKQGLPTYAIVLIVIACLMVIALVFIGLWVSMRRKKSPAAQKKKAASSTPSAPSEKNNGSSGYKSPDYSPGAQPDIIRNNYKADQPNISTLSNPDYRYSQHVEDYADAIDDKPRSRKPIQYSMDEMNEAFDSTLPMENGPPGYYNTQDYRDYGTESYDRRYGAPC